MIVEFAWFFRGQCSLVDDVGAENPLYRQRPVDCSRARLASPTQKEMDMFKFLTITELPRTPAHRDTGSVSGAINAWELKNRALNTKGFVTCPKNYSEFLL